MNDMKKILSLAFVLVAAVAGAFSVPPEWSQRYQALIGAMNSKNLAAFKATFAKDFYSIDDKGKRKSRADFFKEVDDLFTNAKKFTAHIDLKDVKVHGDTVDVSFDFKLNIANKGKGGTMVHEVGVDTWKKIGGKWMTIKTVDSMLKATMTK